MAKLNLHLRDKGYSSRKIAMEGNKIMNEPSHSATVVSTYIYLQPVLTSIIAVLSGREKIEFVSVLCSLMIFGSVYLVSINTNKIN